MKIENDKEKEKDSHFPNSPWVYVLLLLVIISLASGGFLYNMLKSPKQVIQDSSQVIITIPPKSPAIEVEEKPSIPTEEITEAIDVVEIPSTPSGEPEIITPASEELELPAEEPEKPPLVTFIEDILEQGQSKEYLIGGDEYNLNIISIYYDKIKGSVARFNINNKIFDLKKGETFEIEGILVSVTEIMIEEAGEVSSDQVQFNITKVD